MILDLQLSENRDMGADQVRKLGNGQVPVLDLLSFLVI